MRIKRRMAEFVHHQRLDFFAQDVFPALGFGVEFVVAQSQHLRQKRFDDAMVAHDFSGDAFAGFAQFDAVIRRVMRQAHRGEAFGHVGRARGHDAQVVGGGLRRDDLVSRAERVDRFEIIFDGARKRRAAQRPTRPQRVSSRCRGTTAPGLCPSPHPAGRTAFAKECLTRSTPESPKQARNRTARRRRCPSPSCPTPCSPRTPESPARRTPKTFASDFDFSRPRRRQNRHLIHSDLAFA